MKMCEYANNIFDMFAIAYLAIEGSDVYFDRRNYVSEILYIDMYIDLGGKVSFNEQSLVLPREYKVLNYVRFVNDFLGNYFGIEYVGGISYYGLHVDLENFNKEPRTDIRIIFKSRW
jgi:hypothetical protein